jgi:hypothetical protein
MGYFVKNRRLQSGSTGVVLPTGTSANRPDNPMFGQIRYNLTIPAVEYFNGIEWAYLIDNTQQVYQVDNFTGDGSTTIFTMATATSDPTQIMVFVGSIYQTPGIGPMPTTPITYTVNGGYNITFTQAPPDGITINVIHTKI